MIFQAENVHGSASLVNLKEKRIDTEESRNRTHDPDGPIF